MAALPQFSPEGAPGSALGMGIAAGNAQQSWMDQSQMRALRDAQEARAQTQFQVLLPALAAKSEADVATNLSRAASATAQQQARIKYAPMIPQSAQDLIDASDMSDAEVQQEDGSPDWQAQFERLENLQAKYSVLGLFPDGKPSLDAINNAAAKAYQMATTQNTLQAHIKMTKEMVEGRTTVAGINADTKQDVADTLASARVQAAQLMNQARIASANIGAGAKVGSGPAAILQQLSTTADQYEQKAMETINDPQTSSRYMQLSNLMRMKAQTFANPKGDLMLNNPGSTPTATGKQPPKVQAPSATNNVTFPTVTSQPEYDALPPGAVFKRPNGTWAKKPAQVTPAPDTGTPQITLPASVGTQ